LTIVFAGIVSLGLATAARGQPAQPQPGYGQGWYVGLGFAPAWLNADYHFTDGSVASPSSATSFMINGALGYKWELWRFEVEPYWTNPHSDTVTLNGPITVNPLIAPPSNNNIVQAHGDVTVAGALFNAAYDFPIADRFFFTAGFGIGWATVSPNVEFNGISVIDHEESAFAWQLLAGISYAVNREFELQVDYRYTGIGDTSHHSAIPVVNPLSNPPVTLGVSEHDTNLQAVMFSVRWYPQGLN
jgi:opacity protein-like surface antigen